MKVAHLVSFLSRSGWGVSRVVEKISSYQSLSGIDVQVFGLRDSLWDQFDKKKWKGAHYSIFDIKGPKAFSFAPGYMQKVIEYDPDVIHVHGLWTYHIYAATKIAKKTGAKLVISPHGMYSPTSLAISSFKKKMIHKLYQKGTLEISAGIHVTSIFEKNEILELGYRKPIFIIPNGVEYLDIGRKYQHSDKKIVLYLGRLDPKKGIDRLIDAWALLEKDFPNWKLQISGTNSKGYRGKLVKKIQGLNLSNVEITDGVFGEKCNQVIENSDIFVLPTLSESWPLVVGHALMLQVPVITTKGAPFPELDIHQCGSWIEHGVFPLFKSLHKLMAKSVNERKLMGQNGREWVRRDLNWEKISERYNHSYNQLMK